MSVCIYVCVCVCMYSMKVFSPTRLLMYADVYMCLYMQYMCLYMCILTLRE